MRLPLTVLSLTLLSSLAVAQEIIVERYQIYVNRDRVSFADKTLKELNTPEGRQIIGTLANAMGVPVDAVVLGTEVLEAISPKFAGNEAKPFLESPPGYSICRADLANAKFTEHGRRGIETHKSHMSATIHRVGGAKGKMKRDGIQFYLDVPASDASSDHRVHALFDVTFVTEGSLDAYPCMETGRRAWMSKHNKTRVDLRPGTPFW